MTKIRQAKSKITRSLGVNLWGKNNCSLLRKNYRPGMHGANSMGKKSVFGQQLIEKQKFKFYYALTEKQLRNLYEEAKRYRGDTSEHLVGLLERRLSSVVYRSNVAPSIFAAKQFISHRHVKVNGRTVNVSGYLLKEGDVISFGNTLKAMPVVIESVGKAERAVPDYLTLDTKEMTITFNHVPNFGVVPYPSQMNPNAVVEFYSR